jgi:hypothetical protein
MVVVYKIAGQHEAKKGGSDESVATFYIKTISKYIS